MITTGTTYRVFLREYDSPTDLDGTLIDMSRKGLTYKQAVETKFRFEAEAIKRDGFKFRNDYLVDPDNLFRYRLFIKADPAPAPEPVGVTEYLGSDGEGDWYRDELGATWVRADRRWEKK